MSITQIHLDNRTTTALPRAAARPSARNGTVWLDVSAPTEDDLTWLQRTYDFHPLAIEDCRNFNQRAKVDAYNILPSDGSPRDSKDDYLFLSVTSADRDARGVHPHEMEAFLGPNYLVTVHREPLTAIDAALGLASPNARPDFLLYLIVDQMVEAVFPIIDEMEDEIDALEDEILENATQATLERIFELKRQLVLIRKIISPMRDAMNALASTRYGLVSERTAFYFRDVYDHLARLYDLAETSRDLLGNALDAYLSAVSNRLNEVMKRLTLIATIFMPLSFLVGFGGMNFQQLPFGSPHAFAALLALLFIVPIGMMIWFWRSKWV
jgi:magnesium transporter